MTSAGLRTVCEVEFIERLRNNVQQIAYVKAHTFPLKT